MVDKELRKRLLKLLYDHNEEHIGSCFTCLHIIDDIFTNKSEDDIFILSNGHAAYALYVVLEKHYDHVDADDLATRHGGHPNLEEINHIYCSTGSLGQGITVAVGRAAANPDRKVYVMVSDGECAEGSVWESLRYIQVSGMKNIEVHVNANGWACYDPIDVDYLERRCKAFLPDIKFHRTVTNQFPFLKDLDAHYYKMTLEDYQTGLECVDNER